MSLFILPFIAAMIAILAFTYSYILSQPGELLGGWNKFLYSRKVFKHKSRSSQGLGLHPIYKLLIGCEKCIAGQIAFWYYLYIYRHDYHSIRTVMMHLFVISQSILFAIILKSIYKKRYE